ncbi:MAG TPA: methyltransferase domain-containing protein [Pyrinomonadaceae bacterium]|nr:methyltransferase domain-containing protein [Pyrinomonadaceae bacterium]
MRLAYFSPLNPQPSGISDYSEELLPYLSEFCEIALFVDGFEPGNRDLRGRFPCFDYRKHPETLVTLRDYDAIIYHMGNDHRYHAGMLEVMRAHPGVIVFHDFALQDFFFGLSQTSGSAALYLNEVLACHGRNATVDAAEAMERGATPALLARPTDFPLNCELARAAEGIVVHSEWSRARFAAIAPAVSVAHINMPIGIPPGHALENGTTEKAAPDYVVQIANFGLITPGKGIELALQALARLKVDHNFHYTLVGDTNAYFDAHALVRQYDMEDRVTITGQVSLSEFERRIAATDIALNLRERTVGETSASLCRIMAAGVPAIVFNVGAFSELPGDAVVKIDLDANADALLEAYLRKLIEDAELRRSLGQNARRYMIENHDIRTGAEKYFHFLEKVVAQRPRKQLMQTVAARAAQLGVRQSDEALLREVATQVALLTPASNGNVRKHSKTANDNGRSVRTEAETLGRLPKLEGVDYKSAAVEYPSKLDAERSYYLRTKPFYNLANKPDKHLGDGLDAETHRHFTDFANMARVLALPAGAKILDVGCGSGWLSEYFARLGYDVTGIDISEDLINMSRQRVERVPYDVDHETTLRCRFLTHDVEAKPLPEKFKAVICYDALHHFEDERAVFRHLAAMLEVGGLLFILEGHKPAAGSPTEVELQDVMRQYGTLESPFGESYLRQLLDEHGFAIVGDYVSVNGLFEREMFTGDSLPLEGLATDYHYLTCMKVSEDAPGKSVPDSRSPGILRAEFSFIDQPPREVVAGSTVTTRVAIRNAGDTLWLNGQRLRAGVVMPGVRVIDEQGDVVKEVHGYPMLPRAVAPGGSLAVDILCPVPSVPGQYSVKIDLVDQHVCWFEERGSQPLLFSLRVVEDGAPNAVRERG